MDLQTLIQQKLPQDLREFANKFTIPSEFLEKTPDLIELVLRSRSIDKDEEKQSWFNLLPFMNEEQIAKLHEILTREKQKLEEIEKKYEQKKQEIKKKYLIRWQNMGYIKKINDIKQAEEVENAIEDKNAESLLKDL